MNRFLCFLGLITIFAACGGPGTMSDAAPGDAQDVPSSPSDAQDVASAPGDVAQDVMTGPIACGSMTCGATQVCVHPCNGGTDSGTAAPDPFCADPLPACQMHACTCADGYCGSQSYACAYSTGRDVRCMCA
jgi:hypothetical protein